MVRGKVANSTVAQKLHELLRTVDAPLARSVEPDDAEDRQRVSCRLWMNAMPSRVPAAGLEQAATARAFAYKATAKTAADKRHFRMPNDVKTYTNALYTRGNRTRS